MLEMEDCIIHVLNLICIEPKLCQTNDFNTLEKKSTTVPHKGINLNFLEQFKN